MQCRDRVTRFGADLVGELQPTDHDAVADDVQDDRALAAPGVGKVDFAGADLFEQARPADADLGTVDRGGDADGGRRREAGCRGHGQSLRRTHDGLRERVLAVGLRRGGEGEDLVGIQVADRFDGGDGGFTLRERAGLVEQDGVDGAHALQGEAVLHEDAAAGGALGRDRHDERDREAQRMRARDHQDRDGADDRVVGAADERPHDGSDGGSDQREPEQQGGGAVGDPLRTRRGVLRLGDEALDAREGRVVAGRGDLDAQARVGRDGARRDGVADGAGDGTGLTGDHGLVDVGTAVDDGAVGGDAAAGTHDDDIADAQVGGCDRDDLIALDPLGLVGQQRREGVERGTRLRERPHLDPVAEQHDDDQQGELPPELEFVIQDAEGRAPRREERDRDREADQEHHPRPAGAQLADRSGEERPAAPHVHDGAEQRRDPRRPARDLVAEDHREHRRQRDHRDADDQVDPEQPTELPDVIPVAAAAAVPAVTHGRVVHPRHPRVRGVVHARVGGMVHPCVRGVVHPRVRGVVHPRVRGVVLGHPMVCVRVGHRRTPLNRRGQQQTRSARGAAEGPQSQAVAHDEHARQRHRSTREHGVQKPQRGDRDRGRVVCERPEQVGLDRAERLA